MNRENTLPTAIPAPTTTVVAKPAGALARIAFLDHLRYLMVLLVLVYHAVAAYSAITPHWTVHETPFLAADLIRALFDVFMMPVLFFISGFFALASIEKKGAWAFFKDKVLRLLLPWGLAMLVFVPLLMYSAHGMPVRPFRNYWVWFLTSFPTGVGFLPADRPNQMVYWFVSLLFIFSAIFALGYWAFQRRAQPDRSASTIANPRAALPVGLALFAGLTALAYFAGLLFFPDLSWFTWGPFVQFQPTRLVLLAAYFAFGVYARSSGWFADGPRLGSSALWGAASAALAVAYLWIGQPILSDPLGATRPAAGLLLAFALVRSALLLALLMFLLSFGARFWNRSSALDRQLSASAYNIYLTHFIFIIVAQEGLAEWTGGPSPLKAILAFFLALALSYPLSRWIVGRFPRGFSLALLALFAFCLAFRA